MSKSTLGVALFAMALVSTASVRSQQPAPADRLAPASALVGKGTGTSEGQPGAGTVERDYEPAIGGRFIRVRNRSTYAPQAKNPKGEVHEDGGFISSDGARKRRPRNLPAAWPGRVRGGVRDGRTRQGVRGLVAHAIETRAVRSAALSLLIKI